MGLLCSSGLQTKQVCKQELPAHAPVRGERVEKMDKTPLATHPEAAARGEQLQMPDCQAGVQGAKLMAQLGLGCIEGCGTLHICPTALLPCQQCCQWQVAIAIPSSMLPYLPCLFSPLLPSPHCPTHKTPKSLNTLLKGSTFAKEGKGTEVEAHSHNPSALLTSGARTLLWTQVHHTPPCLFSRQGTGEPCCQTWGVEAFLTASPLCCGRQGCFNILTCPTVPAPQE